ncbi:MAG TPA: hypothetical protein VFR80_12820 [Pyrinomonadaceae bacterium]|nr:hypothetical protein [Pyrinomonadaceae bacterium]
MTSNIVRVVGGILLMAVMASTPALGLVSAQDNSKIKSGGGRLEGAWDVQVTLRNCQSGEALRPEFSSITTFMFGGTLIDSTSGMPQAARTPGLGIWSHVGANVYRFKFKSFSFSPTGVFTGWTIITHEATMDPGGNSYESAGTAEFYFANGDLDFIGCSTTTATRFQ